MGTSFNNLFCNKEHWKSPFIHKPIENQRTYELTTKEKVVSVALAIFSLPFFIGTFYLMTAYFKYRALKQMQINHAPPPQEPIRAEVKVEVRPIPPEPQAPPQPQFLPGLTLVGFCPTSQQNIYRHRGFGNEYNHFHLLSELMRKSCTCCDKKFIEIFEPERAVVIKDCVLSYDAMDVARNRRKIRNVVVREPLKLNFQNPSPFKWIELKVQPLIAP